MLPTIALTDRHVAILTAYGEARGEPIEGRIGVACVIRNRVADRRWSHTYAGVCLAQQQFSCWNDGDPNRDLLHAIGAKLLTEPDLTLDADSILRECAWIVDGVMAGKIGPRVGAATHYYATTLTNPPAWTIGARLVCRINHHLFYSEVA